MHLIDHYNTLLNSPWVNEEIKEEMRKYFNTKENEKATYWYLWDTERAVLRGKFITLTSFLKRRKDSGQLRKQGCPPRKTLSPHGFIGESYKHLKKKKKNSTKTLADC